MIHATINDSALNAAIKTIPVIYNVLAKSDKKTTIHFFMRCLMPIKFKFKIKLS